MIKAVIFDFGAVLVKEEKTYEEIAKKLKVTKKKATDITSPLFKKWSCGKINEEKFWQRLEEKLERKAPSDLKNNLWLNKYLKRTRDIKGSWKILNKLWKNKVRLALLSNIIPPRIRVNQKLGKFKRLKDLGFEAIILSCEVGFRKPDPKIYKIVLKKLNLSASSCLFVDDKLANIKAARKLGMKAIRFQSPAKLRKDLFKIGLLYKSKKDFKRK